MTGTEGKKKKEKEKKVTYSNGTLYQNGNASKDAWGRKLFKKKAILEYKGVMKITYVLFPCAAEQGVLSPLLRFC